MKKYEEEATVFISAIKLIAQKSENLENLEFYLSYHFGEWLERFANTPEDLACELREFANIDI